MLPDQLDSRATGARLAARIAELQAESALQTMLGNPSGAAAIDSVVTYIQGLRAPPGSIPGVVSNEVHVVSFYEGQGDSAHGDDRRDEVRESDHAPAERLRPDHLDDQPAAAWSPARPDRDGLLRRAGRERSPFRRPDRVCQSDRRWNVLRRPDDVEARLEAAADSFMRFGQLPKTPTGSYTAPATAARDRNGLERGLAVDPRLRRVAGAGVLHGDAGEPLHLLRGTGLIPLLTAPMQSFGNTQAVFANPPFRSSALRSPRSAGSAST